MEIVIQIIIGASAAGLVAFTIAFNIARRKKGKSSCGCSCAGCPSSKTCASNHCPATHQKTH